MHQFRPWADLPIDILSSIADRLAIIELLSFRGTCKDFRAASTTASAKIESSRTPWLLFPETNSSNCIIYHPRESRTYNKNIPELNDAIILASYQGWLLLFKHESIFFFYPFSGAKIVLPKLPFTKITGFHGAAFSDLPINPHCVVSIKMHSEIIVISKGQNARALHFVPEKVNFWYNTATYDQKSKKFYYMVNSNIVATFSVKNKKKWKMKDSNRLPYDYVWDPFGKMTRYKREYFDFNYDSYVNVCGITFHKPITSSQVVYANETTCMSPTKKCVKTAVWIQPRFFEVDPNQHW